ADPARGAFLAGRRPDPRHYGAARRSVVLAHLARCRRFCDPRRRQQRALSRPRLYRAADRIGRPRWPDRQRQSGVHRRARGGLSGEALTWRKVMGLLLGIAGVGFIVWHRMSVGTDDWHGILFTLASLASIVAGTILFKVLAPKGSLWVGNGMQNLAAGIVLLPFAFTFSSVGDIVPSARLLGAFTFLVLGGSILAYLLWFHLLKVCGATAASAYHFLMPALGMLFAFLVLGEHVEFRDLLGIVPVALGIYLVTRPAA